MSTPYVKQLIDGNDVSVLLGVADEVVKVMDTLKFYIPTLKDMSMGLKLSLELIRRYLPEGAFSRIYLDEQPVDSGRYVAGAVALESGDLNTAGVAMFKIKPKTEGVRLYWAEDLPAGMTLAEAEAHNVGALLESDGVVVDNAKVTCTYKKEGPVQQQVHGVPDAAGYLHPDGNSLRQLFLREDHTDYHYQLTSKEKNLLCVSTGGFFCLIYIRNRQPQPPPQQQLQSRLSKIMLQHQRISRRAGRRRSGCGRSDRDSASGAGASGTRCYWGSS